MTVLNLKTSSRILPLRTPDASHSATFVVGPQGPRGIMRRLSSQVLKAKEVSSISTKSIHLMLLQSWSRTADSQDSISARVFNHTVGCMGPWPALWSTFGTCCFSSDIAPIFLGAANWGSLCYCLFLNFWLNPSEPSTHLLREF